MSDTKHPAEVLADDLHCGCQLPHAKCKYDEAEDMLRTIPALEAERDALSAGFDSLAKTNTELDTACAKLEFERDALRAEVEALRAAIASFCRLGPTRR